MGRNYLPYNMNGFTITDAYGNKASGGGDDPPGAGGSVACCYTLKGTEFTVKWKYYDADRWTMDDSHAQQVETKVVMPSSAVPEKVGSRILEVHFYPDRHVEFQFPGQLLDESRIPVVDVSRWMATHYQEQLDKKFDDTDGQSHRRIARAVATAWLKYQLTERNDLEQYAYFSLLVNSRFDAHPEVQRILRAAAGKPVRSPSRCNRCRRTYWQNWQAASSPLNVPTIPDGLPPPRVEEKQHG